MEDRYFYRHYLKKLSPVFLVMSFLLVISIGLPGASISGMSVNSTSTPGSNYLPLILKLSDNSIPIPLPTLEPIRLFFDPLEASIPSNATLSLMQDAKSYEIGFVQVEITFDNSIVKLTDEVQATDLLKSVLIKSSKDEANSSGRVVIVLGLSTVENSLPPTGLFEIARLTFGAVAGNQNQDTSLSVNNLAVQIVNLSAVEIPFSSDSAIIHIPAGPTPTPTLTSTPIPEDANPCIVSLADACADIGNPSDETFHNLSNWGGSLEAGPFIPPSGDTTKRYQTIREDNTLQLFISDPDISHTLFAEVEDAGCDDSFEIYLNGEGPLYTYNADPAFQGVVLHTVPVSANLINSSEVTITFRNIASDDCGLAAVFNVEMLPENP